MIAWVLARLGYVRRSNTEARNAAQLARIDAMLDTFDVPACATADRVAIALNWLEGAKRLNCEHLAERVTLGDAIDIATDRLSCVHVPARRLSGPFELPRFLRVAA